MRIRPALLLLAFLFVAPAAGQEPAAEKPAPDAPEKLDPAQAALDRGLDRLVSLQAAAGHFVSSVGYRLQDGYAVTARATGHAGVTGLAVSALLAGGAKPGEGPRGKAVESAAAWLVGQQDEDGMLSANGTRMDSHGLALAALAQVLALAPEKGLRAAVERAASFTIKAQNRDGGWHYAPFDADADVLVTAGQVFALHAVRKSGVAVPDAPFERAAEFALRCAQTTPGRPDVGSFAYDLASVGGPTRRSFVTAAAGLLVLLRSGLDSDEKVLSFVREHRIERFLRADPLPRFGPTDVFLSATFSGPPRRHYGFYWGNVLLARSGGPASKSVRDSWRRSIRSDLLEIQEENGSWADLSLGGAYATASAALILALTADG